MQRQVGRPVFERAQYDLPRQKQELQEVASRDVGEAPLSAFREAGDILGVEAGLHLNGEGNVDITQVALIRLDVAAECPQLGYAQDEPIIGVDLLRALDQASHE